MEKFNHEKPASKERLKEKIQSAKENKKKSSEGKPSENKKKTNEKKESGAEKVFTGHPISKEKFNKLKDLGWNNKFIKKLDEKTADEIIENQENSREFITRKYSEGLKGSLDFFDEKVFNQQEQSGELEEEEEEESKEEAGPQEGAEFQSRIGKENIEKLKDLGWTEEEMKKLHTSRVKKVLEEKIKPENFSKSQLHSKLEEARQNYLNEYKKSFEKRWTATNIGLNLLEATGIRDKDKSISPEAQKAKEKYEKLKDFIEEDARDRLKEKGHNQEKIDEIMEEYNRKILALDKIEAERARVEKEKEKVFENKTKEKSLEALEKWKKIPKWQRFAISTGVIGLATGGFATIAGAGAFTAKRGIAYFAGGVIGGYAGKGIDKMFVKSDEKLNKEEKNIQQMFENKEISSSKYDQAMKKLALKKSRTESVKKSLITSTAMAGAMGAATAVDAASPEEVAKEKIEKIPGLDEQETEFDMEPVEVDFGPTGSAQGFLDMKKSLAEQFPDPNQAPPVVQELLEKDIYETAEKYGFYRPDQLEESSMAMKGESLSVEDGKLIYNKADGTQQILAESVDDKVKQVSKFDGEYFNYQSAESSAEKPEPSSVLRKDDWTEIEGYDESLHEEKNKFYGRRSHSEYFENKPDIENEESEEHYSPGNVYEDEYERRRGTEYQRHPHYGYGDRYENEYGGKRTGGGPRDTGGGPRDTGGGSGTWRDRWEVFKENWKWRLGQVIWEVVRRVIDEIIYSNVYNVDQLYDSRGGLNIDILNKAATESKTGIVNEVLDGPRGGTEGPLWQEAKSADASTFFEENELKNSKFSDPQYDKLNATIKTLGEDTGNQPEPGESVSDFMDRSLIDYIKKVNNK